jgi:hypothetical protein
MQYKKVNYSAKKKLKINWNKILFLTPRILAIIYVVFIGVFSFTSGTGITIAKIIPALLIAILLIFTWKKPVTGGIIFLVLGVLFVLFIEKARTILTFFLVSFPPILIGVLLLLSKVLKRE